MKPLEVQRTSACRELQNNLQMRIILHTKVARYTRTPEELSRRRHSTESLEDLQEHPPLQETPCHLKRLVGLQTPFIVARLSPHFSTGAGESQGATCTGHSWRHRTRSGHPTLLLSLVHLVLLESNGPKNRHPHTVV